MKITVFRQEGLPYGSLPENFKLCACFEQIEQNIDSVVKDGIKGDYFFNAHGEVYHKDMEDSILKFFQKGGGLLHIGGTPFARPMKTKNDEYVDAILTYAQVRGQIGWGPNLPFDVFPASLGINPYEPAYAISKEKGELRFDNQIVNLPSMNFEIKKGITLSKGIPMHISRPEFHLIDSRAYMARPQCRQTNIVGGLYNPVGEMLCSSLVFIKNWGNVYYKDQNVDFKPWVIFTAEIENDLPDELWSSMCGWLSQTAFLKEPELTCALLNKGETTTPTCKIFSKLPSDWKVIAKQGTLNAQDVKLGKKVCYKEVPSTVSGDTVSTDVSYDNDSLLVSFRFEIIDDKGNIRDFVESAVVCRNEDNLKKVPKLRPNGAYFDIIYDDCVKEATWVSGTNWQDSDLFGYTWYNPNLLRVAGDIATIASTGMKIVRCHYFMPAWFYDVCGPAFENTHREFFETFDPETPTLNERFLRALEAHAVLMAMLGIFFMPTLFTNVGENMGNSMMWLGQARTYDTPDLEEKQLLFSEQIMERLNGINSFTPDLYNEPDTATDLLSRWISKHRPIYNKSEHILGIGTFSRKENLNIGEGADWHSLHFTTCSTPDAFRTGKPMLAQETWVPTPATLEGDKNIEKYLNKSIGWTLKFGGCGFMPWNWNMCNTNWRFAGGFVDYWDFELGCSAHADHTYRRGEIVQRNWAMLLDGISFDQEASKKVVIVYPKLTTPGSRGTEMFYQRLDSMNIEYSALNDYEAADFDYSKAKIVILPFAARGYRAKSYDAIREFARKGGRVIAFRSILSYDENGKRDKSRNIPNWPGKEEIGSGYIFWFNGFNEENEHTNRLHQMIYEIDDITKTDRMNIKLKDGMLKFTERWSTDERTMPTDWVPNNQLPDRHVEDTVCIYDNDENIKKGFSLMGTALAFDDHMISSDSSMFVFKIAKDHYIISGNRIYISNVDKYEHKVVEMNNNGIKEIDIEIMTEVKERQLKIEMLDWVNKFFVEVKIK